MFPIMISMLELFFSLVDSISYSTFRKYWSTCLGSIKELSLT